MKKLIIKLLVKCLYKLGWHHREEGSIFQSAIKISQYEYKDIAILEMKQKMAEKICEHIEIIEMLDNDDFLHDVITIKGRLNAIVYPLNK